MNYWDEGPTGLWRSRGGSRQPEREKKKNSFSRTCTTGRARGGFFRNRHGTAKQQQQQLQQQHDAARTLQRMKRERNRMQAPAACCIHLDRYTQLQGMRRWWRWVMASWNEFSPPSSASEWQQHAASARPANKIERPETKQSNGCTQLFSQATKQSRKKKI